MAFDSFKINMNLYFQGTNGTASGVIPAEDMPSPLLIPEPDPNDPTQTVEVLDIDSEMKKTANKIAEEYHLAISTARQEHLGTIRPINPAVYNAAMETAKQGIATAILGVLKTMHSTGIKPSIPLMLPIGAAVVLYWSTTLTPGSFLPIPTIPPITTPAPGTLVLFPGNPVPVARGFKNAFSKYDNEQDFNTALSKMLNDLVEGFQNHLETISGIYVGLVPAPPVLIPTVIPWKGITV